MRGLDRDDAAEAERKCGMRHRGLVLLLCQFTRPESLHYCWAQEMIAKYLPEIVLGRPAWLTSEMGQ